MFKICFISDLVKINFGDKVKMFQTLSFMYLFWYKYQSDIAQRPIPVFTNIQHKLFEKIHPDMKRITYTLTLCSKFVGTLFLRAQRFVEAYCKSTI